MVINNEMLISTREGLSSNTYLTRQLVPVTISLGEKRLPISLQFGCIFAACIEVCQRRLCLKYDAETICVISFVYMVLLIGEHASSSPISRIKFLLMAGWREFFYDDII